MSDGKKDLVLGRPENASLAAYKKWILETLAVLGQETAKVNDLSESEWVREWRAFWAAPRQTG